MRLGPEHDGGSTHMVCSTSVGASFGCSFATECAAHSDEQSRVQPHEQTTRHSAIARHGTVPGKEADGV